jgi:Carboxypeptidase regulatory-like domain
MRRSPSHDPGPQRPFKALSWLGALLLLAAISLGFSLLKSKPVALGAVKAGPGAARQVYSNRSVAPSPWRERAAPTERPVIKGVIYSAEGHPIRDAAVTASTFEIAGNIPSSAGVTKSDELGRFELPLQEGTYQLSAAAEGHGPAGATAHTGDTIALVLPESGVISGHVVDELGNPVSRFVIDVIVAGPGDMPAPPPVFSRRFTSLDGAFRIDQLPGWDVVVRAGSEGYAPAYSPEMSVPVGVTRQIDLTLSRGCELTGKVVDASGAPAPRILVDAEAQVGAGALGGDLSVQTAEQAETREDGSFRLENVPRGTVLVRAYGEDSAVTTTSIEVADCAKLQPIKVVVAAGSTLSGVAHDGDGAPIPGARLTLMHRATGFISARTDAEGHFHFDRLPPGRARLELDHQGRAIQRFVKMEPGKDTQVEMTLAVSGTGQLGGRVTAGGKHLAGAQLMVAMNLGRGKGLGVFHPVTDSDGAYHLDDLPQGPYAVSLVSTSVTSGAMVRAGETATVNLDVTASLKAHSAAEAVAP